jgi:hypothetical protein
MRLTWIIAAAAALACLVAPAPTAAAGRTDTPVVWPGSGASTDAARLAAATEDELHWDRRFCARGVAGGGDGGDHVYAFAQTDSGPVFAGQFTWIAGVDANYVARWNGTTMEPLGAGMDSTIRALAIYDGELIAGGDFTTADGATANHLARWNGSAWQELGGGTDGRVDCLEVFDGALIVGGEFTRVGGSTAVGYIARWDGSNWSGLGSGVDINGVYALTVYQDELVAGGQFSQAGGTPASCVASWDGGAWSALGDGVGYGGFVAALAVYGDKLAVGGAFSSAGGIQATNVAWWDGSTPTWGAFGSGTNEGVNDVVYALAEFNDTLVVGGAFHSDDGGDPRQRIVRWDGSQWVGICDGLDNDVEALEVLYGMLFVGGEYDGALCEGERVNFGCPAYWDGIAWHGFGLGIGAQTFALEWFGDKLIVGTGSPAMAGDALVHGVAQWDGATWSPMGRLDGFVKAFAVYNGELYAGGHFPLSGSSGPRNIARWDGTTGAWVSLDSSNEPNEQVFALGVWDNALVAGGRFTSIGDVTANYVARWGGSAWSAFGSGMEQEVYALAAYKGDLIAGGYFVPHVAKWKAAESEWESLGVGMNDVVEALAVWGDLLVAGGRFTQAGGQLVNYVAAWDSQAWSSLAGGMSGSADPWVEALGVFNGALVAGGRFTRAGSTDAEHVARFDGSAWQPLASGLTNDPSTTIVRQFLAAAEILFVVGDFWSAGGFSSGGIARWTDFCLPETVPYRDLPHTSVGGLCLELAGDTLGLIGFGDGGQRSVVISIDEPGNGQWGARWTAPNPMPDGAVVLTTARGVVGGSSGELVGTIEAKGVAGEVDTVRLRFAIPGTSNYVYQARLSGVLVATVTSTLDSVPALPLSASNPMVNSVLVAIQGAAGVPVLQVGWLDPINIWLPGSLVAVTADELVVRPASITGSCESVREVTIGAAGIQQLTLTDERVGSRLVGVPPGGSGNAPLALGPIAPNPLAAGASLHFSIPVGGRVTLELLDLQGRRIRTLVDGVVEAGVHSVDWNGATEEGVRVGPGVYFARLGTTLGRRSAKLVVLQ